MRMRFGRGQISALVVAGLGALVLIPGEGAVDTAQAVQLSSPPAEAEMIATLREWAQPSDPVAAARVQPASTVAEPVEASEPARLTVASAEVAPVAAPAEPERVYVSADVLNMRGAASPGGEVVARLAGGTALQLLGSEGEWRQVTTETGEQGWVHADYVSSQSL